MMLLEILYYLVRIVATILKIIDFLKKLTKGDRSLPKE
jgi:hypothetical protein